jgi:hypothetical protein
VGAIETEPVGVILAALNANDVRLCERGPSMAIDLDLVVILSVPGMTCWHADVTAAVGVAVVHDNPLEPKMLASIEEALRIVNRD